MTEIVIPVALSDRFLAEARKAYATGTLVDRPDDVESASQKFLGMVPNFLQDAMELVCYLDVYLDAERGKATTMPEGDDRTAREAELDDIATACDQLIEELEPALCQYFSRPPYTRFAFGNRFRIFEVTVEAEEAAQ
jgi:hypothetical protein